MKSSISNEGPNLFNFSGNKGDARHETFCELIISRDKVTFQPSNFNVFELNFFENHFSVGR